jgi:hypothetical protein
MILRADGDSLVAITQSDHARLAADLMALWHRSDFRAHPRRDEILFAIREHDNGWREADAAPRIDPESGRPRAFFAVPPGERMEIWNRGVARHRNRPFAALLIVDHARRLHAGSRGQEAWADFFGGLDTLRGELLTASGADPAAVDLDGRWVELADALSLAACSGRPDAFVCNDLWVQTTGEALAIEPFPLAGSTVFEVACRRIPDRLYRHDLDFALTLAQAHWQQLKIHLVPK